MKINPEEFKDLEFKVNFRATAVLDADQYATLVTCMTGWCHEHPEEEAFIRVLQTIEFKRSA